MFSGLNMSFNMLYIDPATTTVLLSSITSIAVSLGAVFIIWWRKIRKALTKTLNIAENIGKEVEDDLVITDETIDLSLIEKEVESEVAITAVEEETSKEDEKKYFNEERIKRILPITLVSLAIPLLLFIIGPLEIYCNNIAEFDFSVGDFLPLLLLFTLGFFIISFCFMFFMPKIVYKIAYALAIAGLFMLFIQMNFLNLGLNSLEADNNAEAVSTASKIINTVVWLIVIGGFITLALIFKKKSAKSFVRIVSIIISCALIVTQLTTGVVAVSGADFNSKDYMEQRAEKDPLYVPTFLTTENLTTLSTTNNVVVFCIDRFDGVEFAEPSMKNMPQVYSNLDGFTYFNDNITMYGRTYPSVVYMITGQEWNHTPREEFFISAFDNNKTISKLSEEGYSVNLYVDSYYTYSDAYDLPDYIDNLVVVEKEKVTKSITNPLQLSLRMAQISCYRSFAFYLKGIGSGISSNTCNGLVDYDFETSDEKKYSTDMKKIYDRVSNRDFETTDKPMYSFIHLSGCHGVEYDENWKSVRGGDMSISIKNSFKIIDTYIAQMKKAGVYDNSTIIITGDHSSPYSDYKVINEPRITGLFVKPSKTSGINLDEHGNVKSGYETSVAPVSHANIWATIFQSEGISVGDAYGSSVFDIASNPTNYNNVLRKCYWQVDTLTSTSYTDYLYTIKGSGKNLDNWSRGEGTHYGTSLMN